MNWNLFLSVLIVGSFAQAATPGLTDVTQQDLDQVTKEFSSNFAHPSVSGAETLGDIFGFEVSLLAGQTTTPDLDKIAKRTSGDGLPNLYHAGLFAAVSVPFGVTGELIYLPKYSSNDVSFQLTSLAAKLTMTDNLLVLPFNMAFRVFQTSSTLDFKQTSGGIDGTVENKNTVTGLQVLVSPALPLLEPYAGLGYLQAKNTLGISGSGSIFDQTFTASQSADSNQNGTQVILGVNANLLFFSLGAEYSRAFDTDRYTAKLGFAF